MAALGRLLIRIGSDTGGLRKGGKQATSTVDRIRGSANRATKQLSKMGAAAGAAGVALAAKLTKSGLDAVDSQAKLARQLGTTQKQLTGLTRAASDAGIEQGQLESNIQALNKRLGEAQEGSGEAQDALEKLGLSANALANMPLNQRLEAIGEAMNGLDTQTSKAAATADLFSRSGLDMINLFEGGSGKIAQATKEMESFGVAVSGVEARQIEAANDAMSRIGDVVQGVSNQLAVQMAPLLEEIAGMFTNAAKESNGFGETINSVIENSITTIAFLADGIEGVRRTFVLAGQAAAVFGAGAVEAANDLGLALIQGPIDAVNTLIQQINRIPGIDVGEVELPQIAITMQRNMAQANAAVQEGKKAMQETLMEPLPGAAMREWADSVRNNVERAKNDTIDSQEEAANRVVQIQGFMTQQQAAQLQRRSELERENATKNLARLNEFMQTRREKEIADHEERMEWLREAKEQELITEQEFKTRKQELEINHQKRLSDIERKGESERHDLKSRFARANTAIRENEIASEMAALRSGLQAMFGDQKAAAIAIGLLKKGEAVTSAYAWGASIGGPPLGAAAAATAGAAQLATINDIKSTNIGSNGGGTGNGGSTGQTQTSGTQSQQSNTLEVSLQGFNRNDLFTGQQVGGLLDALSDEADDRGLKLLVNS